MHGSINIKVLKKETLTHKLLSQITQHPPLLSGSMYSFGPGKVFLKQEETKINVSSRAHLCVSFSIVSVPFSTHVIHVYTKDKVLLLCEFGTKERKQLLRNCRLCQQLIAPTMYLTNKNSKGRFQQCSKTSISTIGTDNYSKVKHTLDNVILIALKCDFYSCHHSFPAVSS